jgi:hypothetical protein
MPIDWTAYINATLAREISKMSKYYDRLIQLLPRKEDSGRLLSLIECRSKAVALTLEGFPDLTDETEQRTAVLIHGTLNHHLDIQGLLAALKKSLSRTSRVLLVLYNPYLRWLYVLTNRIGIRKGELPFTFVTRADLHNLAKLGGFEVVRTRPCLQWPWRTLGFGDALNRFASAIALIRCLGLASIVVLRPLLSSKPSGITCVIPARNERGNIENAVRRFPDLGCEVEIIFVEGHSSDDTWQEIQRVVDVYRTRFCFKALQQNGRGKADAVRLGFEHASQPLLTILDADLTMPPEMLGRFYAAYCEGQADFINGSRLLYPMEGDAMRFLNRLANVCFAKLLSWVLDNRVTDSLCGTKLVASHDYKRILAWNSDFGQFDPFGDFELLFAAASLGFGIIDIPIRYMSRTYGATNIRRFRDGWQLFRMVVIGLFRVKM